MTQLRMPALVWLVFALVAAAHADGPTIRLGTGPAYPPFSDIQMVRPGVATQLVTRVFERLGYSVDIRRQPWNRLMREARNLELAAIYPYVLTPEREEDFLASDPLFDTKLRFFSLAETAGNLDFGSTVDPLRLCRPNGFALDEGLQPYLSDHDEIRWFRPNSLESCFLMLARERVDLVPTNLATGHYILQRSFDSPPDIQTLKLFEEDASLHLLVPRAWPRAEIFLARFNEELARVRRSEAGQRVLEQMDPFPSEPP